METCIEKEDGERIGSASDGVTHGGGGGEDEGNQLQETTSSRSMNLPPDQSLVKLSAKVSIWGIRQLWRGGVCG
jgi:hypothetical protein